MFISSIYFRIFNNNSAFLSIDNRIEQISEFISQSFSHIHSLYLLVNNTAAAVLTPSYTGRVQTLTKKRIGRE